MPSTAGGAERGWGHRLPDSRPPHSLIEKPLGSSWMTLQCSSNRAPTGWGQTGRMGGRGPQPPDPSPGPVSPPPYLGLVGPEVEEEIDHQLYQPPLHHCGHKEGSRGLGDHPSRPAPHPRPPCPRPTAPALLTAAFLGAPHAQLGRQLGRLPGQCLQFLLIVPHTAPGPRMRSAGRDLPAAVLTSTKIVPRRRPGSVPEAIAPARLWTALPVNHRRGALASGVHTDRVDPS